jgi:DNA-binding MarR family transcriptional regulator
MAVGLLVMSALVLGLAPAGLGGEGMEAIADPVQLPETRLDPVGPVSLGTDPDGARIATDLPLPLDVDTGLSVPGLPSLSLEAAPGATADPTGPSPASSSKGPLQAIQDAPPEALFAGSSLLATILAFTVWLAKPAFGLFSRIEDDALARHPLRRQALDYIAANPGASLQQLQRDLGCAWGTAVYHLGRLERAGLVAVRHVEGRRGHWPLGQAPARDALAPTGAALARLVRERPGLPQNELARLAGIGPPAACKQLARLESAGFVHAQRSGKARLYLPTASLDAMLAKASPMRVAA